VGDHTVKTLTFEKGGGAWPPSCYGGESLDTDAQGRHHKFEDEGGVNALEGGGQYSNNTKIRWGGSIQ